MDWYFFQVESTGIWYIIWISGANSTILRLWLNASLDNYDWKKPIDGSGLAIDTSNWTKEFFQENGTWKVRFRDPTRVGCSVEPLKTFSPDPYPLDIENMTTVIKEALNIL